MTWGSILYVSPSSRDRGESIASQATTTNNVKWDTANVYSNGESERIIAKALSKYKIPRNKVVLMTKCYRVMSDPEKFDPGSGVTMHHELADYSKDYVNQWGNFEY